VNIKKTCLLSMLMLAAVFLDLGASVSSQFAPVSTTRAGIAQEIGQGVPSGENKGPLLFQHQKPFTIKDKWQAAKSWFSGFIDRNKMEIGSMDKCQQWPQQAKDAFQKVKDKANELKNATGEKALRVKEELAKHKAAFIALVGTTVGIAALSSLEPVQSAIREAYFGYASAKTPFYLDDNEELSLEEQEENRLRRERHQKETALEVDTSLKEDIDRLIKDKEETRLSLKGVDEQLASSSLSDDDRASLEGKRNKLFSDFINYGKSIAKNVKDRRAFRSDAENRGLLPKSEEQSSIILPENAPTITQVEGEGTLEPAARESETGAGTIEASMGEIDTGTTIGAGAGVRAGELESEVDVGAGERVAEPGLTPRTKETEDERKARIRQEIAGRKAEAAKRWRQLEEQSSAAVPEQESHVQDSVEEPIVTQDSKGQDSKGEGEEGELGAGVELEKGGEERVETKMPEVGVGAGGTEVSEARAEPAGSVAGVETLAPEGSGRRGDIFGLGRRGVLRDIPKILKLSSKPTGQSTGAPFRERRAI